MMTFSQLQDEFDRQVENVIQKKYYTKAGLSQKAFLDLLTPLQVALKDITVYTPDFDRGYLPFVIVIKSTLIPTEVTMELIRREGKTGITKLFPLKPKDFSVIDEVAVPDRNVYLLVNIDRGKETLNIPPSEAIKILSEKDRSPLTIDEGIAILTHFPEFLMKNNCFSLLASRTGKDQRVPALWINANKEPNLGWCWNGNPHTWLGSASCKIRLT